MIPSRGLLHRPSENAWYHVSSRGQTVVLRPLEDGRAEQRFGRPEDEEELARMFTRSNTYSIGRIAAMLAPVAEFPAEGYPHQKRERWQDVAAQLEAITEDDELSPIEEPPEAEDRTIPVSRLRRFYETLRLIGTSDVHGAIATHLARSADTADALDTLFEKSLAHLERYQNVGQPFHPGRNRDWVAHCRDRQDRFANCLVANLAPDESGARGEIRIEGDPSLAFQVVDYEVSPLRTAGGHTYEDGRPGRSSGLGGMDLLLAAGDGTPVVGEVKAPGDTSLFVALVQALTYAAEILTRHQAARLRSAYADVFPSPPGDARCEILILVSEDDTPRLMDESRTIVAHLLGNPEGAIARRVRRITVASVRLEPGARPSFSLGYSEASSSHSPSESTRTG
jgi:hypothetical protein